MTDLNISFVSLFWVSAARRRRSTMATWIMSMSPDKAFGQWPWIDFFTPNISHMLAAANFHRSSRSFWENYFQLCHDYSCKCRNVRLTALSLTADDQEIAAGRAQDTQTGSCSESVRRASHFYNDNNGAVTARILSQLSYPSRRKTRALMDEEKINLPNFVPNFTSIFWVSCK